MLTAPGANNRPLYAAKDIPAFYIEHCPKIFPEIKYASFFHGIHIQIQTRLIKMNIFSRKAFTGSLTSLLGGPKYDGVYLKSLVEGLLANLTLKQTLTNVVIPSFDIKRLQPVIFTTRNVTS